MAGSLGFASRLGGRGSVTAEQAAAQMYSNGIVSGFVISPATPTANMTVTVGGVAGTPDVMVATNAVGNNVFLKNRNTDAFTLSMTAPASNSVIYSVVGFTDDLSVATSDATSVADNPSKCGLIAVAGTSAASPVAPSDAQIRTAITSAGFTGSQAAYGVLGYVTLASTTTTITAPNISQVGRTTPLSVAKVNGGSTAGVLTTDASGNVSSESRDFTTAEFNTGAKWIDGKTIYRRSYSWAVTASGSEQGYTDASISYANMGNIIRTEGGLKTSAANWEFYPFGYVNPAAATLQNFQFKFGYTANAFQIRYNAGTSGTANITVYYTKP